MRKYVKQKLEQIAERRGCTVEDLHFVGFWGANKQYASGWLSQWFIQPITLKAGFTDRIEWRGVGGELRKLGNVETIVSWPVDEITLASAEHAMMYMKAMLFNDHDAMVEVLLAQSPADAKSIGRNVKGYDNAKWDAVRYDVVRDINLIKFSTPDGKEILQHFAKTAVGSNVVFVETSPYDAIWGIKNRELTTPDLWAGDNLLGFAHTDVYDAIVWGKKFK